MNTASTASKDAREGLRDVKAAAGEASGDIRDDLAALREDFGRLAEQFADIVANQGGKAWRRARGTLGDVVSDAQDKGRDAASAVRDVSDNFVDAIDDSLAKRPYTTLALVAVAGFIFGATWRR